MNYEKALSDAYERGYNAGLKDNGVNAVLYEVRALIEKIEEVQEIMDTAELSLISGSSLDKMVEMVRIKNDLKQKLSEHFG